MRSALQIQLKLVSYIRVTIVPPLLPSSYTEYDKERGSAIRLKGRLWATEDYENSFVDSQPIKIHINLLKLGI